MIAKKNPNRWSRGERWFTKWKDMGWDWD